MNKLTDTLKKQGNGKPTAEEKAILTVVSPVHNPDVNIPKEKKPVIEVKKEMTLMEKILKVENLQLVVEKRAKLVQTRSELERFQVSSNDFNCTMRLNDSDGNVFLISIFRKKRNRLSKSRRK